MSAAMTSDRKIALVTGATAGIGQVAARELVRQGYRVGVVGRNPAKCRATAEQICQEVPGSLVDTFVADLSSQAEVRRLADEVRAAYPRLDVLLNNAGAMYTPRQETGDGIERTWALNHLAYFLLTNLLLDLLDAAPAGRVVSVASDAHKFYPTIRFRDIEWRRGYNAWQVYGHSKLANILFTRELARRLKEAGSPVTANCVHPGIVQTDFMNGRGAMFWFSRHLSNLFAISPERGADTAVWLATAPEVATVSGEFFAKRKPHWRTPAARNDRTARRLWDVSEAMTGEPARV